MKNYEIILKVTVVVILMIVVVIVVSGESRDLGDERSCGSVGSSDGVAG